MDFNHTIQQTFDMSVPGTYTIDAWLELPTDGNSDNDSIIGYTVMTNGVTNVFPDTTTFDNFTVGTPGTFLNGWDNDPNNVFNWFVHTAGTPSFGTGPVGDTSSSAGTGNYIYYEATNVPQGEEGSVFSGCFDIAAMNKPELQFYYHMFGASIGELHLDLNINGFLIQDIIPAIVGDQGNQWNLRSVDLTPYKGDIRVVFRAVRGTGFQSDVAIDQVVLYDTQPVSVDDITTEKSFEVYPNPISNSMVVSLAEASRIEVYNILGVLIMDKNLDQGNNVIDVNDWNKGLYFVTLRDGEKSVVKKVIKY